MSSAAASLWPAQIRAGVQTPWAILQGQADALTEQTRGALRGEVTRREDEDGEVTLALDIVVPSLGGYRHRVLAVTYEKDRPYPAVVDAEVFRPVGPPALQEVVASGLLGEGKKPANRADSDEQLIALVRKALQSAQVVSVGQSLVARAAEAQAEKERDAEQGATPPPDGEKGDGEA